jgi:hypothetical protein
MQEAKNKIAPLLKQCRHTKREVHNPSPEEWPTSPSLSKDGAHLIRFLAQKGVK